MRYIASILGVKFMEKKNEKYFGNPLFIRRNKKKLSFQDLIKKIKSRISKEEHFSQISNFSCTDLQYVRLASPQQNY